jgi:hypothetical protein
MFEDEVYDIEHYGLDFLIDLAKRENFQVLFIVFHYRWDQEPNNNYAKIDYTALDRQKAERSLKKLTEHYETEIKPTLGDEESYEYHLILEPFEREDL